MLRLLQSIVVVGGSRPHEGKTNFGVQAGETLGAIESLFPAIWELRVQVRFSGKIWELRVQQVRFSGKIWELRVQQVRFSGKIWELRVQQVRFSGKFWQLRVQQVGFSGKIWQLWMQIGFFRTGWDLGVL